MALTKAQKEEIARVARKNAAKRAETLAKKVSDREARTVSSVMNKRPGSVPGFISKQTAVLSKSERDELGRTLKANAAQEAKIQKQRRFAKGEGKLPLKERVGTKAEYKKLGEDIKTRRQIIAYAKQAKINQAERAKNPKPAKPATAAATPAKEVKPVATKKTTPAKTTAKKAAVAPKTQTSGAVKVTDKRSPKEKVLSKKAALKEVKKNTPKNAVSVTDTPKAKTKKATKPKATKTPQLQTLKEAEAKAPKPKSAEPKKLQTLAEAKAKAPAPKMGPEAPKVEAPKVEAKAAEAAKPKGKVATKVASTKTGKTLKAASQTSLGKQVTSVGKKPASLLKKVAANKKLRVLGKSSVAIPVGVEIASILKGSTAKDFKTIQKLENKLSALKGEKPKYTNMGGTKNILSSVKGDVASLASNITMGAVGKTRQARIAELKKMINKASGTKPAANKPNAKPNAKPAVITTPGGQQVGGTPKAITGNKYRVTSGDTLSGIAARAGVSLSELRKANPQITDPRKIYRNTGVVIPKSGKVPTGGYSKKGK